VKFGLSPATLEKLQSVFAQHSAVERVLLFGSRARGGFRVGSDIDLALEGGEEFTHAELLRIMSEVDDLLLPYQVDLLRIAEVSDPDLLACIQKDGTTIYRRAEKVSA